MDLLTRHLTFRFIFAQISIIVLLRLLCSCICLTVDNMRFGLYLFNTTRYKNNMHEYF